MVVGWALNMAPSWLMRIFLMFHVVKFYWFYSSTHMYANGCLLSIIKKIFPNFDCTMGILSFDLWIFCISGFLKIFPTMLQFQIQLSMNINQQWWWYLMESIKIIKVSLCNWFCAQRNDGLLTRRSRILKNR